MPGFSCDQKSSKTRPMCLIVHLPECAACDDFSLGTESLSNELVVIGIFWRSPAATSRQNEGSGSGPQAHERPFLPRSLFLKHPHTYVCTFLHILQFILVCRYDRSNARTYLYDLNN